MDLKISSDIRKLSLGFLTLELVNTNRPVLLDERELAALKLKPASSYLSPGATIPITNLFPLHDFKQEIKSQNSLLKLKVDEVATISVSVKNTGNEPWFNKGIDKRETNRVALGFHWIDSAGKVIREGRTILPNNLVPGSSVTLDVKIQSPSQPGDYALRISMVQEHVAWFHDKGAAPCIVKVKIK